MRSFALLLVLVAACGTQPPPATCPNDLPAACPSPAPAYDVDIAPIFRAKCLPCHAPGGQEASAPLDTHAAITARKRTVLSQVFGCRMPPAGSPPLSPDERAKVLAWLVCGAP